MNNFVKVSGSGDTKFCLRWRGKQKGPYSGSVIEAKLVANEIGLLHEILHGGKWVTIRDYIAERETILRLELQARQAEEKRAREQSDRHAKEREEHMRQAELAEANRNSQLVQADQVFVPKLPINYVAKIYKLLLKTICIVSLLAFFLSNITISIPVFGKMEVSMFDFLTSKAAGSNTSTKNPQKPSVENVSELKLSKLTVGTVICLIALLALLFHYLTTLIWGVLTFGFRNTAPSLTTGWLCLGLQFPILFSIGTHMALVGIKNDVAQQSAHSDPDAVSALLGLSLVNNTSIEPGVIMWLLMALALIALGINAVQKPSRT